MRLLVVFSLWLLATTAHPALAESAAAPEPAAVPPLELWVVLDPRRSSDDRLQALQAIKQAAETGDHAARCTLGRLLAPGSRHPAQLPAFDAGDAATWLSRCVVGGDLDAMPVMAEMMLADGKPLDAMIWMQAYLKLAAALAPDTVNSAAAYKAGLLARIEKAYGGDRPSNEEVLEYVAGFLAQYADRIAAGVKAGGMASYPRLPAWAEIDPKASRTSFAGRFTRDMTDPEDELVYATFLIEVAPDGTPDKVMTFEAYPDGRSARILRSHAQSRRFLPQDTTSWAYLPVFLDNRSIDLLPAAERSRRPPR